MTTPAAKPPIWVKLRFEVPSSFPAAEIIHSQMETLLATLELDEDTVHWLTLGFREAVNNAILHGNQLDPAKTVQVEMEWDGRRLRFVIADEGSGFRRENLKDPLKPENLLKPSGRGIFCMQKCMEKVEFGYNSNGRFAIIMEKSFAPKEGTVNA
jgi:serine/threonine-protein kinase RsbW